MADSSKYLSDSDAARTVFGLKSPSFYRNYPRLPFEYYIQINLDNTGPAQNYYLKYFVGNEFAQIQPLVKSIEMPSMKIDTVGMNQYNRKRLIQNKISFEPIKAIFHDVADGKTLAFWEMYYSYYFRDALEAGSNTPRTNLDQTIPYSNESTTTTIQNGTTISTSSFLSPQKSVTSPINNAGDKQNINDILSNEIVNHNFGSNFLNYDGTWPSNWDKQKNLIQSIEIFQVHGGRFNQVTLVNPRIAAFNHDTLNYAGTDKTLELTFTFEYEYAYYNVENAELDEAQLEIFASDFYDIQPFSVVTDSPYSIDTSGQFSDLNNSSGYFSNPSITGNNLQDPMSTVIGSQVPNYSSLGGVSFPSTPTSTSSLSGLINLKPNPNPNNRLNNPPPAPMSFAQTAQSPADEFVVEDEDNGISPVETYVPVDLSSPVQDFDVFDGFGEG